MIKKGCILFILGVSMLSACVKKNKYDVDVSNSEVEIKINRLDKEIFELDPGNVEPEMLKLIDKYGEFFELYSARIINLGNPYDKDFSMKLSGFITDYTMNKVYEKVMQVYPDMNTLEENMNTAFKRYHYFFPERKIPAIYTYVGGFNQSIVVADSILGIGADKYLGKNCEFYDRLGIAKYLQQNMSPENIPTDALRAWAITEFEYKDSVDNLVNNMIYQGKLHCFLEAMFPNASDSLIIGFTAKQLQWCTNNEKQMWDYLIENKLLFSTDYMTINKHINPAPFTSGYPHESPGRASVWLGWQIVKSYMDKNDHISIKDLMLNNDYQEILTDSRYEP